MPANADLESIVNEPGRGFLGHLAFLPVGREEHASSIQHYPYRGRKQFLIDFETERHHHRTDAGGDYSEWFLLTGVDSHIFENEFLEPVDQSTPWTSWSSYDAHMQLLLVRVTKSPAHEIASMTFNAVFMEAVEPTGLKRSLIQIGSTTHFASLGAKEPDQAWRPHRLPPSRSRDWPSAVIEVAYSETEAKLGSDVRFWMRASGGDVKVVLTLRIDRQQPKIRIEKWVSSNNTNTRYHLDQNITISKSKNHHIILSNAPLTIGFEELFLRPASIPRERDIGVDAEKLQYLATEIWDEQGF
ncbi:hypothetical protein P168DRAFT_316031 [Aspergillus campestris IBT 28561]|uniref:Uncharacterized protein n=1 Tax=Aspergillus campestris (strain IBT 28561) TaxID=1392248 RepID=A0A2I1DCD9_ASPC2|nr:uncharacterized protein P168DRAFT_316031 [Aspergillus campestris IBT 28561]PKY07531.1 hypothetical protein P168DRAFT_316031 [Aspergillus campestris IBT 28561]